MAISRSKKEEILKDLQDKIKTAKAVYFAKNEGMTVLQSQQLRRSITEQVGSIKVAKKTLICHAAKDNGVEIDINQLDGAVSAVFADEDEIAPLKTIAKFGKDTEKLSLVGAIFEGKWLGKDEVIALSAIPGKQELLERLVGSMQSPIANFAGVGRNLLGNLVRVTDAYREQKANA